MVEEECRNYMTSEEMVGGRREERRGKEEEDTNRRNEGEEISLVQASIVDNNRNVQGGGRAGGNRRIHGMKWVVPKRYKIAVLLGSGAYGCVCRAYDNEEKKGGAYVAIKRFEDVFMSKTDALRILREIAILRRLEHSRISSTTSGNYDHPFTSPILSFSPSWVPQFKPSASSSYSVLAAPQTLYVFFEYGGMDLHKLAASDRFLELDEIQFVIRQLCEVVFVLFKCAKGDHTRIQGVRYLHNSFVIHRDLKPANILMYSSMLHIHVVHDTTLQ
eukprot:760918-Hanusia_phi.AAC.6